MAKDATLVATRHAPFVQTVIVAQTLEIQCLIIKMAILNSHSLDIKEVLKLKKPFGLLTSLIGHHELLDDIVSEIIKELVFDETIFDHTYHFEKFEKYIFSKSIKVKFSPHRETDSLKNDQLIKFLEIGCCEFAYDSRKLSPDVIRLATKIVCYMGVIEQLFELIKKKTFCRLRSIDLEMEAGEVTDLKDKLKRLVVSVRFDVINWTESNISEVFSWLIEINEGGDFEFHFVNFRWATYGPEVLRYVSSLNDGSKNLLDYLNFGLIKDNAGLRSLKKTVLSIRDKMKYYYDQDLGYDSLASGACPSFEANSEPNKLIGVLILDLYQPKLADILGNIRMLSINSLEQFSFTLRGDRHYNSHYLPSYMLTVSGLIGGFPSTLKSLNVNLNRQGMSFYDFWHQFISGLKELLHLKISYTKEHGVDFTKLHFPGNLLTIELIQEGYSKKDCEFYFDKLPSSLVYLQIYDCYSWSNFVDVSSIKIMSFDQLKKPIILKSAGRFQWITDQSRPQQQRKKTKNWIKVSNYMQ
ncbi:unnamed protein product [Ambrosiozyma monospora]|uniref:Unnamed protein product n=1 Tax=Ambrosiozyma monospora TaxID=43982 RepID=A0ACB5SXM5_AMBMO|nr:unnamed protein product [Ambrosiozyma monospora]